MPALYGPEAPPVLTEPPAAVVELSLLLPTNRAEALIALSRRRGQSVGQILRQWIERGLAAEE
jgi:uncharacterized protein with PIN domain